MNSKPSEATVYLFLPGDGYVPAAIVQDHGSYCTFKYGKRYLQRANALPIDPVSLPLERSEEVRTGKGLQMFNALRDVAPDKWGRKVLALVAGKDPGRFSELEILTAFHSPFRVGALAFGSLPTSGPHSMAPWVPKQDPFVRSLKGLEDAMRVVWRIQQLDDDKLDAYRAHQDDPFYQACTSIFSVGGARPKCQVELDGSLWIAKFSKPDDAWKEPRLEYAAMQLARQCGIEVAETRMVEVGLGEVLLVKRFDRTAEGDAKHMISGLTLGDRREDGDWGSYQDLAEQSRRYGDAKAGEQLFRRMVFNMAMANTDDHLRNQAWFVEESGVGLTPAFDITPQWHVNIHKNLNQQALTCGTDGHAATRTNALSNVHPFGITQPEAERIVDEIQEGINNWPRFFQEHGVIDPDIKSLAIRIKAFWNA